MNLIDEDFNAKKEVDQTKKITRIIIVAIILVIIAITGIFAYMLYLQSLNLKVIVNDQQNADIANLLVFENDGTIYVPVRKMASYFSYESYNGEYTNKSEDTSKCYVQCDGEVVNLTLNSNKIYKLNLQNKRNNYTYIYMDKPVKAINGELYITTEGMQKVFNTTFNYDQNSNTISIYTMPYLISRYTNTILNYGYTALSEQFENRKTAVQGMLVVTNDKYVGVINSDDGTEILECKYDNITYQEATGDFIVCSNNKYGIIGANKETKVEITYDTIRLMDYDAGLYLVSRNGKYGVIDLEGNNVIYAENDQIGIDISKFPDNDLKTGYILLDNLIPVQRNEKWGLFDKNGKQVVNFEYDSFGYIANNNREALNLLVVPNYNVIVACLNERYTLLNASGEQAFKAFVDDIYMTINGGKKSYTMIANNKRYDVEDYLDRLGVQPVNEKEEEETSTNTTTNTNNSNTTNETDQNSAVENNNQVNNEGEEREDSTEQTNNTQEVQESQES